MKKNLSTCTLVASCLSFIIFTHYASAQIRVSGSVSGVFVNPNGGVVDGVGTNSFSWGEGINGSGPSSLSFSNEDFQSPQSEKFSLGTLRYFNGTIQQGTGSSAVDLQLSITVNNTSGDPIEIVETLRLVNTPNEGTPEQQADRVFLPKQILSKEFEIDGVPFLFEIVGFGNIGVNGGGGALDEFFVLEGGSESADLIGRISCGGVVGYQLSDFGVPVTGGEQKQVCYKLNMSDISSSGAFTMRMSLLNPHMETLSFGVCSMANADGSNVKHPVWVADYDNTGNWSCMQEPGEFLQEPSFHFGCRDVVLESGKVDQWAGRGILPPGLKKQTPYVDFLRGKIDNTCASLGNGENQYLAPSRRSTSNNYANVWTLMEAFEDFPSKNGSTNVGCSISWPTGNWFTMQGLDTYLARLEGTIIDAPTGSTVTFTFPEGSPEIERTFTIPPADSLNPTCQGDNVNISEPFVIPPTPATIDFTVEVPEECSALREGERVRFTGSAVGDEGSPVYQSGQFIVGHDGTCLFDKSPPVTERVTILTTSDGFLDVQVAATDAIAEPLSALLRYQDDNQEIQEITMGFGDPPVVGDTVIFRQIIGPFAEVEPVNVDVNVADDASNPTDDSTLVVITSIERSDINQVSDFTLDGVYPNPFSTSTTLQLALASPQYVTIEIFDVLGRRLSTLANQMLENGNHNIMWNADQQRSGVYFLRIKVGDSILTKKVLLIR